MDWRLKCAAHHTLNLIPGRRKLHELAQRRLTRRYLFTVGEAELQAYSFHKASVPGGRVVEFGCGSNLLGSLLLSAAGAREVLAYDLDRLATLEQINHVIPQLRGRVPGEWPLIDSFEDLERHYRVRYLAPADVRHTGLPAGSVDLICSTSVLEHVPEAQIREILTECRRIAAAGGRLSFIIDYHDHYSTADPAIPRFNFYRYDGAWRFFNPTNHYQNRLRHSDFERLFASFPMIVNERRYANDGRVELPAHLSAAFRGYCRDDLITLNGFFVLAAQPS